MTNSLAKGVLAPLLDTQPLAQFRPMLPTGKPDEQGVLVPIKRIAVSPLAGDFALPAPIDLEGVPAPKTPDSPEGPTLRGLDVRQGLGDVPLHPAPEPCSNRLAACIHHSGNLSSSPTPLGPFHGECG